MDSVSYIAKNHCRDAFNMIYVLLLAIMSAIAFVGIGGYAGLACGLFFGLMALITLFHTRGSTIGCTSVQIPSAIISFSSFCLAIAVGALGFSVIHYPGVYDYVNEILHQMGYTLIVPPETAAILLGVCSLAIFIVSFFAFCAVKYMNTLKRCLKSVISCHGAGIFVAASIIMFVIAVAVAFAFVLSHGGLNEITSSNVKLSLLAEIAILAVLMVIAAISAGIFIRETSSFKEIHNETMKVETNADGTVYVPIKVYSDSDNYDSFAADHDNDKREDKKTLGSKKPFITTDPPDNLHAIDGSNNEHDII